MNIRLTWPTCVGAETELGPCKKHCGKRICDLRLTCVRPAPVVKRNALQRLARWWRISNHDKHVQQLEDVYRQLKANPKVHPQQLRKDLHAIEVAIVNRSIASRP